MVLNFSKIFSHNFIFNNNIITACKIQIIFFFPVADVGNL